jgi:phenylalanyl-tRNA synthetase beta chain
LAGIVGGADSAVQPATQKVLLEVASFDAGTVRKTARRLSINTESSKRFSRGGLDPELVERTRARVIQLLQDTGALEKNLGVCSAGAATSLKIAPVPLRWEKAEKILGYRMDREGLTQRLGALGFREEQGGWLAPSWRRDVREEIDLFEELVRLSDLAKVPASFDSLVDGESEEDRADQLRRQIRAFLVERGYFEVLSGALVRSEEAGSARLTLSAGPDAAGYRQSLLPNLGRAAGRNISRGVTDLKLFELGRVSLEGGREEMRLGLLVSGRERPVHWQEAEVDADCFSLQGIWHELGIRFSGLGKPLTLREMSPTEKKSVGVKSTIWMAEGKVSVAKARLTPFTSVSSYPGIQRDMALVLPEKVSFADVEKAIRAAAPAEMESLIVFDRFVDASGKKVPQGFLSLGCRLQFRSSARTLTEEEVGGWEKAILQSLASRCEAKLRTVL